MTAPGNGDRRIALKTIVVGGSAVFGVGAAAPALRLALAPVTDGAKSEDTWIRIAKLADLKDGEPRRVPVLAEVTDAWTKYTKENLGAVWLIRNRDEVRAMSVTCPHLGCGIEKSEKGFGCPCHTSNFDGAGKRVSGPSPRDMDSMETRVVGDGADRSIEVKFKKYRQGIPEREEIG
ncbi:MAG TPA: Rieske (2Fe-2S) protein [Polyangiaceae bacterium]|nr:Rieske (2Fe-2S) protein [Polyangiaceae bacterium]